MQLFGLLEEARVLTRHLTQVWGEYANSTQKDHRSQSQTHPQQGWATHFLKGQHEKLGLVWIAAVINL